MTDVRSSLVELGRLEIPRPKCQGLQFIATRGRQGFYRTIRANGAQFGLQAKPQGPRRPKLTDDLFQRPPTVKEEDSDGNMSPPPSQPKRREYSSNSDNDDSSSSQMSNYSVSPQPPSPVELPPDYPEDYVPPHLRNSQTQVDQRFTKRYQ